MTSINEVVTLLFTILNSDATLQGATYLTSTGRIFKSSTRPANFSNPAVTMRLLPTTITGEQKFKDEWLLWVNLYLQNLSDLTPDMIRAGRIETQINVLLDNKGTNNVNIDRFIINRYLPGRMLPIDEEAPNETVWQFQYYVEAS